MPKSSLITYLISFVLLPLVMLTIFSFTFPVKEKIKRPSSILIILFSTLVLIALGTPLSEMEAGVLRTVINLALIIVYYLILLHYFHAKFYLKVSAIAVSYLVMLLYDTFSWLLILEYFGPEQATLIQQEGWATSESFMIVAVLVIFLIRKFRKPKAYDIPVRMVIVQLLIVCVCAAILVIASFSTDPYLVFFLLMLLILCYIYFKQAERVNQKNHQHELNEQKHLLLQEHYEALESYQETIHMLKHDMKNQLIVVNGYMLQGDYPQAHVQLNKLLEEAVIAEYPEYTSHKTINILLGHKARQAEKLGIACHFTIKLTPVIAIDDTDLTTLVSNILDNAIEACSYVELDRFIELQMILQNHSLALKCENSIDGQHQSFATRKKDRKNHGLGMKSIQRIVEKYHGENQFQWGNHTFAIELTIFEN